MNKLELTLSIASLIASTLLVVHNKILSDRIKDLEFSRRCHSDSLISAFSSISAIFKDRKADLEEKLLNQKKDIEMEINEKYRH